MTAGQLDPIEADRAARIAHWRERGVYSDYTYADAFRDAAQRHGDVRVTFHSQARSAEATIAETYEETERLAAALHGLGLRAGDRFAVVLPTWYDATLAYIAALKLGLAMNRGPGRPGRGSGAG